MNFAEEKTMHKYIALHPSNDNVLPNITYIIIELTITLMEKINEKTLHFQQHLSLLN